MYVVKEVVLCEFDLIVVVGGDGMINEVVNGFVFLDNCLIFGVILVGIMNDFVRVFNILCEDILKVVDMVINGVVCLIDIGQVNGQYFINIVGGGCLMELMYDVLSKFKMMFGQFVYYLKGMEMLFLFCLIEVEIEYDGKLF